MHGRFKSVYFICEDAEAEESKFNALKLHCDADERKYDAERAKYDAQKTDFDVELGTYKADETKFEDHASSRSREKAAAESDVAAGLGLVGGGVVMAVAAGTLLAAAPFVVAGGVIGGAIGGTAGGVGIVAGAGMTPRGYHSRGKAEDFKQKTEAKQ